MRAVGLHADVVVAISRAYRTTCTLVRSGNEAFVVDSPVFPDELEILPAIAEQAGFPVVGAARHARRLGPPARPLRVPRGAAGLRGDDRRAADRAGPARRSASCATFDEEMYVERPSPLSLPGAQTLPVPGHCGIGEQELELHPADGHTEDGMAVWIPWARVLVAGDYLSPVEIPMLSETGSLSAYLATLDRLEPLVEQADHVVPGPRRAARRHARRGDPARGPRLPARRCASAGRRRSCRSRGAAPRSGRSTPRTRAAA